MTQFNITTKADFNGVSAKGNFISDLVENDRDIYSKFEALANMCDKKFEKFGGLDLSYLAGSSMLKSITREARRVLLREWDQPSTMEDDMDARKYLAERIMERCCC